VGLPLVYVVTLLACFLARKEPATLLAPLAGPSAGRLYGHVDCTMATVYPAASLAALVLLLPCLGLALLARRHALAGLPLLLWSVAWSALAWMSVVNSTS